MKIDKDHLYYGAAVLQVAEDDRYTSINQFRKKGKTVRCACVVNNDMGLYLSYRARKSRTAKWDVGKADEYPIQLDSGELSKIDDLSRQYPNTFLGLICVGNERRAARPPAKCELPLG